MKHRLLIIFLLLNIAQTAVSQTAAQWVLKGFADDDNRNYEAAIADYTRAIAVDAGCYNGWYQRDLDKDVLGRWKSTIADFTRAIALQPDDEYAYDCRGTVKLKLGQYASAITDFDRLIALDPWYVSAFYNLGIAKNFLGRFADAVPIMAVHLRSNQNIRRPMQTGRGEKQPGSLPRCHQRLLQRHQHLCKSRFSIPVPRLCLF